MYVVLARVALVVKHASLDSENRDHAECIENPTTAMSQVILHLLHDHKRSKNVVLVQNNYPIKLLISSPIVFSDSRPLS